MQNKPIREGDKTVLVCKTISATSKGNNESPRSKFDSNLQKNLTRSKNSVI